jgi:transposase
MLEPLSAGFGKLLRESDYCQLVMLIADGSYPPKFRREAIRLVRSPPEGRPISRIAKELGVSAETLRNWVKQDEIDAGERKGLTTEEQEELRSLRRENKVLKQEKEILAL